MHYVNHDQKGSCHRRSLGSLYGSIRFAKLHYSTVRRHFRKFPRLALLRHKRAFFFLFYCCIILHFDLDTSERKDRQKGQSQSGSERRCGVVFSPAFFRSPDRATSVRTCRWTASENWKCRQGAPTIVSLHMKRHGRAAACSCSNDG